MKASIIALAAATAAAAPLSLNNGIESLCTGEKLTVTARVLSSTADPSWTLSPEQAGKLCLDLALMSRTDAVPAASGRVMGYKWFEVASAAAAADGEYLLVGQMPTVEKRLLATGAHAMKPAVYEHIAEVIGADQVDSGYGPISLEDGVDAGFDCQANAPVIGPDSPQACYDLANDCQGCFASRKLQGTSNCYAYANDHATDAFPEPGCGSGECFTADTCDDLVAAAVRDGLVWLGTDLPEDQPSDSTHAVAAFIWPGSNHHWIRKDGPTDGTDDDCDVGFWSHKPGSTSVTNVDNNGDLITDPAKSDFSPWTEFCGYLEAQPSTVNIGPGSEP